MIKNKKDYLYYLSQDQKALHREKQKNLGYMVMKYGNLKFC